MPALPSPPSSNGLENHLGLQFEENVTDFWQPWLSSTPAFVPSPTRSNYHPPKNPSADSENSDLTRECFKPKSSRTWTRPWHRSISETLLSCSIKPPRDISTFSVLSLTADALTPPPTLSLMLTPLPFASSASPSMLEASTETSKWNTLVGHCGKPQTTTETLFHFRMKCLSISPFRTSYSALKLSWPITRMERTQARSTITFAHVEIAQNGTYVERRYSLWVMTKASSHESHCSLKAKPCLLSRPSPAAWTLPIKIYLCCRRHGFDGTSNWGTPACR